MRLLHDVGLGPRLLAVSGPGKGFQVDIAAGIEQGNICGLKDRRAAQSDGAAGKVFLHVKTAGFGLSPGEGVGDPGVELHIP